MNTSRDFSNESRPLLYNKYNHKLRYFWKFLIVMSTYYVLPSLQFVFFQAHDSNVVCYYNEKCKYDLIGIPAFNNVISNICYIVLGLVFIFYVKYKTKSIEDTSDITDTDSMDTIIEDNYGVYSYTSLYYSLGVVLSLEGIFSGIYHICPSKLNFQFDTTFMFIGSCLMILVLYSKRHPLRLPSAFNMYLFLSLVVLFNILPLSGISNGGEAWFWSIIYLLVIYFMIVVTFNVYYGTELKINMNVINNIRVSGNIVSHLRPKDLPKFIVLLLSNISSLTMIVLASYYKTKFTEWMLGVFIINLIIYFVFYIINKLINNERINVNMWIILFIDLCLFTTSLIYFEIAVTDKMLSPSQSRKLNKPCIFLDYFDYHDMWHIFSSISVFLFMYIVYNIDNNLRYTVISDIKIF